MVAPIFSNKKGIYKDLYREIDSDNKQKKSEKRRPRGIYANLYRQFENDLKPIAFKNNENENYSNKALQVQLFKSVFNDAVSKLSLLFSAVATEFKIIIFAFALAQKPVNSYIQNVENYQDQGIYNND